MSVLTHTPKLLLCLLYLRCSFRFTSSPSNVLLASLRTA